MSIVTRSFLASSVLIALAGFSGCSQTGAGNTPVVTGPPKTDIVRETESVAPGAGTVNAVSVTFKVDKALILSTEFLYGADLQYSSQYDATYDLYNQSLAIGHIPARFRIAGEELQLVADNKRLYPSEVNHPEQLLSRFQIVTQTETELTVSTARSGVFLGEIFEGTRNYVAGGLSNPVGVPPRDTWVRSLDFASEGNYILQQTSVMLTDGVIGEFMESIFPRKNIEAGSQFEKFILDPDHPTGGDGDLARWLLLPGETVRDGEAKLTYAQHFDISGGKTIDWYTTRNIPDEYLSAIKEAVEGWNRYFRSFKGINRDVVLFKGRLPEEFNLGDPRFNVINWDNRRVAGAAYESQATDPQSGVQSHSLIYMPAAWLQIGEDYWAKGQSSDSDSKLARSGALASARVACLRDLKSASSLLASGKLAKSDIATFSRQLLKQTLFHEVGHALGFAHNFKGSLSYDRKDPNSFSTSIMDYNDFEIERAAFSAPDSADGPLLEYDRQVLSAIYNKKQDIAATDPVLPACNDAIADNEAGGVDPFCVRYDIEKDPTASIQTALDRVNQEQVAGDVTLSQALRKVPALVLTPDALSGVKTQEDLEALGDKFARAAYGSLNYFVNAGKASIRRVVLTNVRALLVYADGALPEGVDAMGLREREFAGIQAALALKQLPAPVLTAITEAESSAISALGGTPFLLSLDATKAQTALSDLTKRIDKKLQGFAADATTGLSRLHGAVLASLTRFAGVSYFFDGTNAAATTDYEKALIGILADATVNTQSFNESERTFAASALVTYKGRIAGDPAIQAAFKSVNTEAVSATTNAARDLAESLLAILAPAVK